MVWESQCFEDWEEMDDSATHWNNHRGVCRTALATPGLLNNTAAYSLTEKIAYITQSFSSIALNIIMAMCVLAILCSPLYKGCYQRLMEIYGVSTAATVIMAIVLWVV